MAIKTVELVWNGAFWCDRFTGVKIPEGIYPPPDQQAEAIGTTLEEWTGKGPPPDYRGGFGVSYLSEPLQPIGSDQKSLEILIDRAVELALKAHTVGSGMYFAHRDKLATAGFVREVVDGTNRDVEWLRERIVKLERPWYERWFSR